MKILTTRTVNREDTDLLINGEKVGYHHESLIVREAGTFWPDDKHDKRKGGLLEVKNGYLYDAMCQVAKAFKAVAMNGDGTIAYDGTGKDVGWCIVKGLKRYLKKTGHSYHEHVSCYHAARWLKRSAARAIAKKHGGVVARYSEVKAESDRQYKVENGIHNSLRAISMIFYRLEKGETPDFPVAEMKIAFDGLRAAGYSEFDLEHGLQHYGVYHQTYSEPVSAGAVECSGSDTP